VKNKFNEDDEKKVIDFLNFVAKNATFKELNTENIVAYFKLLAHMQTQILPKIKSNIFEIKEIISPKKEVEESKEDKIEE
jgi:hypothetical protein